MTDQPTLHTCARCGVADADVREYPLGFIGHYSSAICIAAIQRQSARRLELLLECIPHVYARAHSMYPDREAAKQLLLRVDAEK